MKDNTYGTVEGESMNDFDMSERQKDALQEAGNIAAGSAATALSTLLMGERVMIDATDCRIVDLEKVPQALGDVTKQVVAVYMGVQDMNHGSIQMIFSHQSAMILCDMFSKNWTGGTKEITDREIAILSEIGNICICAYLNTLSKLMGITLMPYPPAVAVDMIGPILEAIATDFDAVGESAVIIETEFIHRYGKSQGHFLFILDEESKQRILRMFKADIKQ
ncbi:MAG: chemotaxis protein CheC [Proteobacteria bacterium]|nr:chemotaxis protein CheC [Pseudomonadota bacterium]